MPKMRLLALSIATALVSGPVSAAVVCEFEPTPDMNDCSRCFKVTDSGAGLYLGGERVASSTDAERFRQFRFGAVDYQRGIEKTAYSQRNGAAKLYEVCYSSAPPVKATNLELVMSPGSDIQEFHLRVDGSVSPAQYDFALISTPTEEEGSAGLFGNTLVFSPAADWSGMTTLRYRVTDSDGHASTAVITIREDEDAAELRAEREQLETLQVSLQALQGELVAEEYFGSEAIAQIAAMEREIGLQKQSLEHLDKSIAGATALLETRTAGARLAQLERAFGFSTLAADEEFSTWSLARLPIRSESYWLADEDPTFPVSTPYLIPQFTTPGQHRAFLGQQPLDHPGKPRRRRRLCDVTEPAVKRRLTKREKKRAKRARRKLTRYSA